MREMRYWVGHPRLLFIEWVHTHINNWMRLGTGRSVGTAVGIVILSFPSHGIITWYAQVRSGTKLKTHSSGVLDMVWNVDQGNHVNTCPTVLPNQAPSGSTYVVVPFSCLLLFQFTEIPLYTPVTLEYTVVTDNDVLAITRLWQSKDPSQVVTYILAWSLGLCFARLPIDFY